MKKPSLAVLLLAIFLVACDPSYKVTQSGSEYSGLSSKMLIKVSPTKQLAGTKHWAPKIEIYNSDSQSLFVNSVELIVGGETYHPDPQDQYPQAVGARSEVVLPAHFTLKSDIQSAFAKQPGELRFRYSGAESGVVKIFLQGQR